MPNYPNPDPLYHNVLADNKRRVRNALSHLEDVTLNAYREDVADSEVLQAAALALEIAHLRGNADHVNKIHRAAYHRAHTTFNPFEE